MKVSIRLLFLLFASIFKGNHVEAGKILAISFFATKSHKLTYMPVLEELGKRGHNITMLTPVKPLSSKPLKNIKEIMVIDWEEFEKELMGSFDPFERKKSNKNTNPFAMSHVFVNLCKKSFDLPQVQNIINQKEEFDLVFFNPMFNECALGIIHLLKAPIILWCPIGVTSFFASFVGGHFPPAFHPNMFLGYPAEMTFFQRFINFGFSVMFEIMVRTTHEPKMAAVYREKLNDPNLPSPRDILADQAAMVLSNGHFSLHRPRPFYPDVVDVGGIHSRPANPLPKELEDFIEKGGNNGFIYFSMGSALKGSDMPEDKRKAFLKVFSKLEQQVIWKWETEEMEGEVLPKNVKLSKWLPQQDLLGHSKIRMFITHCGGGSLEESIYHGCPLLGIPMFGDQPQNAKLAKQHEIIVDMDWNDISEESLMSAIQEILNNPKYAANVKKLSTIYRDQPDHPLDRAVYWVEYVMRHKGAPHLRSPGRRLNFFQYHSYDVIMTYLGLISLAIYLVYRVAKYVRNILVSYFMRKFSSTNKTMKPKAE